MKAAHPHQEIKLCHPDHSPHPDTIPASQGMSLREWYAGLAMQSIISNTESLQFAMRGKNEGSIANAIAEEAFTLADAMIQQTEQPK